MTTGRAPSVWWGAFLVAGAAAACFGQSVQLGFAGLAIGVLGLPHGASDLAVIDRGRRNSFLLAYLGCIVAVVLLWRASPGLALGSLLVLSGLHFALDDRGDRGTLHQWALGGFLIGGPVLFHHATIAQLFFEATANQPIAQDLTNALQLVGLLATAGFATAIIAGWQRRHSREGCGELVVIAMTLALPPLIGFAIGFVLLHASGQTVERQREIGCATLPAYLWRIAPVLAGAFAVLTIIGLGMARGRVDDPALLFAGIAALATPHMLVTPLWRGKKRVTAERHRLGITVGS